MAQAYNKRVAEPPDPHMPMWKASSYSLLQATSDAKWERIDPFDSYRPLIRQREPEAGPHVMFLKLRQLLLDDDARFLKAPDLFASKWGLLGLFHNSYSAPILPYPKSYISPEAMIENERLERVDPAVEGLELVAKAVNESRPPTYPRFTQEDYVLVAMPEEVRFATRDRFRYPDDPSGPALSPGKYQSWEEVRTEYDALFVFDPAYRAKASVLARSENIFSWNSTLLDFPPPPYDDEERLPALAWILNKQLADASPKATLGEHGNLTRDWRCNTLLQAMYVMLFLDLTGGAKIRGCASHDCSNHFRVGPQPGSKYCSKAHARRAATRMQRGQEP
jgi:hypothetical protein